MNPIQLLKQMATDIGVRYLPSKINELIDYVTKMIDNGRVITINDDQGLFAVLFFSITDKPDDFLIKGEYEFKPHNPSGKSIYVEKLVAKGWNKELRKEFEIEILKRYPWLTHGVWHRIGDRKVITNRRLQNVPN